MTAIQPYRERAPLVRFAASGVAVDIRLDGPDRYELRLAGPGRDVEARLMAQMRDGGVIELGALDVPQGSIASSRFPIVIPKRRRLDHVYLEVSGGDDVCLRVVAPLPPQRGLPRAALAGISLIAVGAAALAGGGLADAWPRAPHLGAPLHAVAGQTAELLYDTGRGRGAEYRAMLDDGLVLATNALPAGHGAIRFDLPATSGGHRVTVDVRAHGPLGTSAGETAFAVEPAPSPVVPVAPVAPVLVPRIAAFSAHIERLGEAASVLASYLAVGNGGELRILDAQRNVVARTAFSHLGTQRVPIPAGALDKPLIASLVVTRGDARATSEVFLGAPQSPLSAAAQTHPAAAAAPQLTENAVLPADGAPFAVVGPVVAGRPFTVRILREAATMHLRLEDDAGNPVDEVDVRRGAGSATLRAPAMLARGTYYVNCFYDTGAGQEVIVRPVVIEPR